MKLDIQITDSDLEELLVKLSTQNELSATQYATNIIVGWLQNRIKNKYLAYVQGASVNELKTKLGNYKLLGGK